MNAMRLFWGLVVLSLGAVLIGINTGMVDTSILWSILAIWPVVLIALGLRILVKSEKLLSLLIFLLVLVSISFVWLNFKHHIIYPEWGHHICVE